MKKQSRKKRKLEQFLKEICKHYGADYKAEINGTTFLNTKEAQEKFFNELRTLKHNEK